MSIAPLANQRVAQLIDANLDRSREGLRVVEDWCRFGLRREDLVSTLKDWRQQLAKHHHNIYKQARSTTTDKGIGLSHPAQRNRVSPLEVVAANCSRAEEALRVLEEFTRISDPLLAKNASNIRYGLYEVEKKIIAATYSSQRREKLKSCNLCLITSPQKELISIVTKVLEAGVGMIQYRCKKENDLNKFYQAKELAEICKSFGALFIINDHIDLALAIDADGVHLGQNDFPIDVARKLIGDERIIGRSTHSLKQLKDAEKQGADYLGVGPVYDSTTKPDLDPVGVNYVHEASKNTQLPCFAIGGIKKECIDVIRSSGLNRVAVVGAIMDAEDPFQETTNLLESLK